MPSRNEDLKHHTLQPGDFTYWKIHLQKKFLQSCWKDTYQVLLTNPCATKLQGIDSCILMTHIKKVQNTDWTCTSSGDLKVKISWNWSRWHLMTAFPRYLDQACSNFVTKLWWWCNASMIFSICDLGNIWMLDEKCLRALPLHLLLLPYNFNRFPVFALYLLHGTLHPGQKAPETRKVDSWSMMISEKDLHQKGKMLNI